MNEPAVVDDAELLRLAAPPAEPLMPVLARSAAMWPLIVVFALFPITFATYYRTFDNDAARWGLRAVDTVAAPDRASALIPGRDERVRRAAPLSSWLQALVLTGSWREWPMTIVAVSAIATVLTGFAVHVALRRLAGARFALWTTLFVCAHPAVLAAGTTPAPRALGACLQVAALGCLLRHRISLGRVVGVWNIATGVLLGATLLASGPAYVVGVGTATIYVVLRSVFGRDERDHPLPSRGGTLRSIGALAIIVVTSWLVGGWWLGYAISESGGAAVAGWLEVRTDLVPRGVAKYSPADVLWQLIPLGGVVLGFSVFGVWRCFTRIRDERAEPRRVSALLLAWFGSALVGWSFASVRLWSPDAMREWEITTIVPLLALAVVGIDAVRERFVGVLGTALLGFVSLIAFVGWHTSNNARIAPDLGLAEAATSAGSMVWMWLAVLSGLGLVLVSWRASRAHDEWQRAFATTILVAFVALQIAIGFVSARQRTEEDRALKRYQSQLARFDDVEHIVLVVREPDALPVEFATRVLWPRAPLDLARTRDEAVAVVLRDVPIGGRAVLVDTDAEGNRPLDPTGERFHVQVVSPRHQFRGRRLRAHVLDRLPEDESTAAVE